MNNIRVLIGWAEKNYSATNIDDINGTVVVTAKTFEGVQDAFAKSLKQHIKWSVEDGDTLPSGMQEGQYELSWELTPSAMLHRAESFTTLTAISKATGINLQQLGHYASGHRTPRLQMQQRIIDGIRSIAGQLLAL